MALVVRSHQPVASSSRAGVATSSSRNRCPQEVLCRAAPRAVVGRSSTLSQTSAAVAARSRQPLSCPGPGRGPIGQGLLSSPLPSPLLRQLPVGQRQTTITHSFLGVGAPEALLVGVVALVVFGPKGLADAAKSLGQTLRAFQPTIKEVVEVSQEIKGTLEQELGLDELRSAATLRPTPRPVRPAAAEAASASASADDAADAAAAVASSSSNLQPVTEELARQMDPAIELKRAMSEQAAWGGQAPVVSSTTAAPAAPSGGGNGAAAQPAPASKELSQLSLEELEAELARRRNSA